jgi:hypothetical protein
LLAALLRIDDGLLKRDRVSISNVLALRVLVDDEPEPSQIAASQAGSLAFRSSEILAWIHRGIIGCGQSCEKDTLRSGKFAESRWGERYEA